MPDLQATIRRLSESNSRLRRVAIVLASLLVVLVMLVALNEYHRSQMKTARTEDVVARIMDDLRKEHKSRPLPKDPKGDTYLLPIPPRLAK
jgi:hypothetical protein